jgi:hypothetical protein
MTWLIQNVDLFSLPLVAAGIIGWLVMLSPAAWQTLRRDAKSEG